MFQNPSGFLTAMALLRRALRATRSEGDDPLVLPVGQPLPPEHVTIVESDDEANQDVVMLVVQKDFMEVFSPPRVSFAVTRLGLLAGKSLDLTNGYDFLSMESRAECLRFMSEDEPGFVMLSPPCTMYSPLQVLFNLHKMSDEEKTRRFAEADALLNFAMTICKIQHARGRYFCFEHPQRASSWQRASVQEVLGLTGSFQVTFDQCRTGLVTPGSNPQPIRKRTIMMSNALPVRTVFQGLQCNCPAGAHHPIEGSIDGISLSKWCQHYTPGLCQCIATAVSDTLRPTEP